MDPLSLTGRFWHAKCVRRPRDWQKGAPSPLIGPGGMAAATADRPSNRESNIVLRGLRSLADRRQPRSHPPDWERERRQVLVNSVHVRADTHACNGAGGGWWKEAKAGVVVKKLLLM